MPHSNATAYRRPISASDSSESFPRMTPIFIKRLLIAVFLCSISPIALSEERLDGVMPFRGFCIASPGSNSLNEFIAFVHDELAPRHVNTLVLRVDYRYRYESHPELR